MAPLQSVARELCRAAAFTPAPADDAGDGRTLVGYAATFGQPTEIRSWEGHFFETIRAGAFKKSLRERTPVMQFDHGRHPLIGSIPIGSIEDLREDENGLYTEARISDNWLMQPIRDAIAEGSISGMSFRFEVVREEWRDKDGKVIKDQNEVYDLLWMPGDRGPLQRELIEVKVRELGPVVFPAYDSTSVGVRARSVAGEFTPDSDLANEVRRSLARDLDGSARDLEDPEFRREVARALLFGDRDDAPVVKSPEPQPTPDDDETRTDDAPLTEHPSTPDAPPSDGHPSTNPDSERLRNQIREIRELMQTTLAPIVKDE